MAVKFKRVPPISRGDPIRARWLNDLRPHAITGRPPVSVRQSGGDYEIGLDPAVTDWWLGKIVSPPAGESDVTPAVYWVKRQKISTASSDVGGFAASDLSDVTFPSDFYFRVTNIAEAGIPTHMMPSDSTVMVFRMRDSNYPTTKRYAMWQPVPGFYPVMLTVQNSDAVGDSDTDCDFTYEIRSLRSDLLASDLTPLKQRMPKTAYRFGSDYGSAFWNGSAWLLFDALEVPLVSDCA